MKAILMRSLNKGGRESHLVISCHQTRLPVPGLACIQLCCWPRKSHENLQTTEAVANTMCYCMENHSRAPLLKITPIQHIGYREVNMAPTPLHFSVFAMGRYYAGYLKKNKNADPTTKPLTHDLLCL